MNPIVLIAGISILLITVIAIWWLLSSADDSEREKELLEQAAHEYGGSDSRALDRLYQANYRRACLMRRQGPVNESTLRDMLLIFNLRNRALEAELECESSFIITKDEQYADQHLD